VAEAKLSLAEATAARLKIVAPFDGIAGIRNVNVGDYLKDGADIVNIEDLDAIYVDFRLPERFQTKVRPGQTATVDIDALPGRRSTRWSRPSTRCWTPTAARSASAAASTTASCSCAPACSPASRRCSACATTPAWSRGSHRAAGRPPVRLQAGRRPDQDTRIAQRVEVKVGMRQPGQGRDHVEGLEPGDTVVTAGQQRIQRTARRCACWTWPRALRLPRGAGAGAATRGRAGPGARAGRAGAVAAAAGPATPCMNWPAPAGPRPAPGRRRRAVRGKRGARPAAAG
jgi:membrane fusion protein (multidrug efflux system)